MRLNWNVLNWSFKARAWVAGGVWLAVAFIAFFCSDIGKQTVRWTQETWQVATDKADRRLKQVEVNWQNETHYTKTETILSAIQVAQGEFMSNINLTKVRDNLEKLPWVRSAVVERFWPNTLRLTIEEKMPLALWQNNRKYHPLDERAEVINTSTQLPADLLLVVGKDAPKHLISLIRNLEEVPEIYQYVRAAVRVGERRWNLKLYDAEKGLEILLPETNVAGALARLDAHNKSEKLIKRQVAAIDLRTKDKVILKPIPTPQKKPKGKKK